MTAVQLARLRNRRSLADFNRVRFLPFAEEEDEGAESQEPAPMPRPTAGGRTPGGSGRVAWKAGSETGSIGSPNEVRGAEDPSWCGMQATPHRNLTCPDASLRPEALPVSSLAPPGRRRRF